MNRLVVFFFFATFLQAMPSWGYESSVIAFGKEWLQPKDFIGYSYNQVIEVCPSGACSGTLPGSTFDLTGYTWASVDDATALLDAYREADRAILEDFAYIGTIKGGTDVLVALLSDPPYEGPEYDYDRVYLAFVGNSPPYTPFEELTEIGPAPFEPSEDSGGGAWFWKSVATDLKVHLEEPIDSETHSGIGSLRGWAIADDGIDRVEIYIDGKYKYDAPYGGSRGDVGNKYPEVAGSDESGFSLAIGYSNLGVGEHTAIARAFNTLGEYTESTATFNVVEFDKKFIPKTDVVDTAQAEVTLGGDEILLDNVSIGGRLYELRLRWRTQEQGFEIIEIR